MKSRARTLLSRVRRWDPDRTVPYVARHVGASMFFALAVVAAFVFGALCWWVGPTDVSIGAYAIATAVVAALVGLGRLCVPGPVPVVWDTVGGKPVTPDGPGPAGRYDSWVQEMERLLDGPAYEPPGDLPLRPVVPPADPGAPGGHHG